MDALGKKAVGGSGARVEWQAGPSENSQMADYLRGRRNEELYVRCQDVLNEVLSLEASHPSLTEPLNHTELDNYRKAAICLHEALRLQGFHKPPNEPAAWYAYKTKIRMEKWAAPAVWSLLLLDIFETPQWCKSYPESSGCRTAGGQDYILSGVPLVPLALAAAWEGVVLLLLCVHFVCLAASHLLFMNYDAGATCGSTQK